MAATAAATHIDDHIHNQTINDVALRSIAIESLSKEFMLALHIGRVVKLLFTVVQRMFSSLRRKPEWRGVWPE